jgi:hypothetical protein
MKFSILPAIIALGAVFSVAARKATYNGFRAVRVPTFGDPAAVRAKLGSLPVTHLNVDTSEYMDLAIAPDHQLVFDMLGINWILTAEDLGAKISAEGDFVRYECKQNLRASSSFVIE